jgi:hypothetical protein
MDCLNPFPRIHLRMGRDEIVRLGHEREMDTKESIWST